MNILITSIGRRTRLLEFFKNEIKTNGKIVAVDSDNTAVGLYHADKSYIIPRIDDPEYLNTILSICKKEKIKAVISLIDPELNVLSKHRELFESENIQLYLSEYEAIYKCYDKYKAFKAFKQANLPTPLTYENIESFNKDFNNGKINFPIIMKPRFGSGGKDVLLIHDRANLELQWKNNNSYILQEYIDGISIDIDFYVDIISREMISIFPKERIHIRSGESDKAISINDQKLFNLVEEMASKFNLIGPLCADIFMKDGQYYILEINPRFGGSYPMAHSCGINFPKYILNNMKGIPNQPNIGNFEDGIYIMKNDNYLTVKRKSELITNQLKMKV